MLMIVAVLAQYEVPRSTINYYNYRSQDTFMLTSFRMKVTKTCRMTLKFKLKKKKKKCTTVFHSQQRGVGVQAARKESEENC